jgi:NAD-dependent SIR2 family protein deacetylase
MDAQINPVYALALKLTEEPGVCAVFLGAGISKGAGVPTSWEIFLHSLGRLYRMEEKADPPDEAQLLAWRKRKRYGDLGYTTILEALYSDASARRNYLDQFFRAKEPSAAHRSIAALCRAGLVRVIVTTNFDQLMEQALRDEGLAPDVVSSPNDLQLVRRREISPCWLLKLHGDIAKLDIRNTPEELEALPDDFRAELMTIVQTYSLLIIGYAAWEAPIVEILDKRTHKQSLFWMDITSEPNANQEKTLKATDGHWIRSESADVFLSDLSLLLNSGAAASHSRSEPQLLAAVKGGMEKGDWRPLRAVLRRDEQRFHAFWAEFMPKNNCNLDLYEEGVRETARAFQNTQVAMLFLAQQGAAEMPRPITRSLERLLAERAKPDALAGDKRMTDIPRNVTSLLWQVAAAGAFHDENYRLARALLDIELADPDAPAKRFNLDWLLMHKEWRGFLRDVFPRTFTWCVEYVSSVPPIVSFFGDASTFAEALLAYDLITALHLLHELKSIPHLPFYFFLFLEHYRDATAFLDNIRLGTTEGEELCDLFFGMSCKEVREAWPAWHREIRGRSVFVYRRYVDMSLPGSLDY